MIAHVRLVLPVRTRCVLVLVLVVRAFRCLAEHMEDQQGWLASGFTWCQVLDITFGFVLAQAARKSQRQDGIFSLGQFANIRYVF